jgi:hypothetical protein
VAVRTAILGTQGLTTARARLMQSNARLFGVQRQRRLYLRRCISTTTKAIVKAMITPAAVISRLSNISNVSIQMVKGRNTDPPLQQARSLLSLADDAENPVKQLG